jgi:hypothetical protein
MIYTIEEIQEKFLRYNEIDLSNHPEITELPEELPLFITENDIDILDVSGCTALKALPEGLNVNYLYAKNCISLKSVPFFWGSELDVSGCTALEDLPEELDIERLDVSGCTNLTRIPLIGNSSIYASELYMRDCPKIERLPENLHLDALDVRGCTALTALPDGLEYDYHPWSGDPVQDHMILIHGCVNLHHIPQHLQDIVYAGESDYDCEF